MSADADFDRVLDAALDRLASGEPPASILAAYPAYAADLAPLLSAAQSAAATLSGPVPAPDLARGRQAFLRAAQAQRRAAVLVWRPALTWLALAALLVVLVVGTGAASANALPGESLYPVKRAVESVRLALTRDPARRDRLTTDLAALRRAEAARVVDLRREATLAFTGEVDTVAPDRLVISGLTVLSVEASSYAPGDQVAVEARTTRTGELLALRLTRLSAAVRPTATPTQPQRSPTATQARPTPSSIPSERSPRPTATTRPRATERPATQRPAPTTTRSAATARPSQPPRTATERSVTQAPAATAEPSARPSQRPPRQP